MGFESSTVARRRLASLAATNELVQEALSPSSFPGLFAGETGVYPSLVGEGMADMINNPERDDSTAERVPAGTAATKGPVAASWSASTAATSPLAQELDVLAQDIVSTGAGGALLAAYAAQARALTMVVEAARRGQSGPLPAAVLLAAKAALSPPNSLAGLAFL